MQQRKIKIHWFAGRLIHVIRQSRRPRCHMGVSAHHIGGDEKPRADHLACGRVDPHLRRLKDTAPPGRDHELPLKSVD